MTNFPPYKVVPTEKLVPYARNSRTHSKEQIDQVAASIVEFGFTNPILIDGENTIIAGHCRLLAANKLDIQEVPVIEISSLSEAQKRAYIIADNKLALNAGWDDDMLRVEFDDLMAEGFDVGLTGFSLEEIGELTLEEEKPGLTDDDEVPEAPEIPITAEGDIWTLGNHRLMCGDSTDIETVKLLIDGSRADLVFTDPPYGMEYGGGRAAGSTEKGALVKAHGAILGDDLKGAELLKMVADSIGNSSNLAKQGAAKYICLTWRTYSEFYSALVDVGIKPKSCIVWDKKSIGLGYADYRPQHEFIFYSGDQWYGDKAQSDVWYMSRGATGEYVHPTQKPVELIQRALRNSSKSGDLVHDCFGGSGSTLIACEKMGRKSCLMEIDTRYCDVIINRWQDYTGQKAVRSDGVLYDDLVVQEDVA